MYSLLRQDSPVELRPSPQAVKTASPPLTEATEEITESPLDAPAPKRALRAAGSSAITAASSETQPECNAVFEATGPVVNGSDYSAQFKWTHGVPTNAPCWKDLYAAAIGDDINNLTFISADRSTGLASEDHVRVFFTPLPSPSPSPSATPSPTPATLPVCKSGQRIGSSPTCRCLAGTLGNSGKCR